MMIAILMNAVIIFLLYFPELENNFTLKCIDDFFIVVFIVEAIVKLSHLKPGAYFKDNWNKFDFAIVVLSLPTLLIYFYPLPNTSVLLLLRLFRLIRLVKFIRFIPRMETILNGLGRALKSSVFVILALMFLNFMLAILSCHFYGKIAPELFGNPLTSSYTVFQLFTVEGWNEIPQTIAEHTDNSFMIGASRFYFILIVLAGGIFGMSLANAIFVDEMTIDNNVELEIKIDALQEQITDLKLLIEKQIRTKEGAQ